MNREESWVTAPDNLEAIAPIRAFLGARPTPHLEGDESIPGPVAFPLAPTQRRSSIYTTSCDKNGLEGQKNFNINL